MASVPVIVSVGKWHIANTLRWTFKLREDTNQYLVDVAGVRTREDLVSLITRELEINTAQVTVHISFWAMYMGIWNAYPPSEQLCVPPFLIRDDDDVALFQRFRSSRPFTKLFVTVEPRAPPTGNQSQTGPNIIPDWFTTD